MMIHAIDFCFQCAEFPCDKTGFGDHLYRRHVEISRKMREMGVEAYYDTIKDLPRYEGGREEWKCALVSGRGTF